MEGYMKCLVDIAVSALLENEESYLISALRLE